MIQDTFTFGLSNEPQKILEYLVIRPIPVPIISCVSEENISASGTIRCLQAMHVLGPTDQFELVSLVQLVQLIHNTPWPQTQSMDMDSEERESR